MLWGIAGALVAIGLWVWFRRSRPGAPADAVHDEAVHDDAILDTALTSGARTPQPPPSPEAVSFGYKSIWLAFETDDPERVLELLGVDEPVSAGWESLGVADDERLFVTPAIDGWVLAVGHVIPTITGPRGQNPALFLIRRFSKQLDGRVAWFATDRLTEYHGWALADAGRIRRAYAYVGESGETLLSVGERTEVEAALELAFYDERSAEAETPGYWERDDLRYPDEEDVLAVAAGWSLDTRTLEARGDVGLGWSGRWVE